MSNIITPKFRVSYPNVFRAKRNDLNGFDEYSVVALFPKGADITELKAAAHAAIVEELGADQSKWPTVTLPDGVTKVSALRNPFRNQAEKEKDGKLPEGYEAGALYLNLKARQRPGLVDGNNQAIIDESQFYGGCWARAEVRAFYYDKKGNKGVAFGLQNLQKMEDGESLSGRTKAENAFQPVAGAGAAAPASAASIFG